MTSIDVTVDAAPVEGVEVVEVVEPVVDVDADVVGAYLLAVDIEKTGQNMGKHRMPAFGAAVVRVDTQEVPDAECVFRAVMNFADIPIGQWDEKTLVEFWFKSNADTGASPFELLRRAGTTHGTMSEEEAMFALVAWLRRMAERFPGLVIVTDTAGSDIGWLDAALGRYETGLDCLLYATGRYRPVRDVSSFHMGVAHATPRMRLNGSEKAALAALEIDAFPEHVLASAHSHDPVDDAKYIGRTAAFIAATLEKRRRLT